MKNSKSFASDNYSGIHPLVLKAIQDANSGHQPAYGSDEYTARAVKKFKEHFGNNIDVYFVYNGTAANVVGLKAVTKSFNSIICAQTAHLNVDECGAPEALLGCKLIPIQTTDGKLTVELVKPQVFGFGNPHHAQPKVISITQPTELGTLYQIPQIKKLADFAHKNNMLLHVDGARLANAAAALNVNLKSLTADAGVDVLSFGGTKNGMMCGEAVIFFDRKFSADFEYIRKQNLQLNSKMRFIAAQFEAMLSNNLWLQNAHHSNKMARQLAQEVAKVPLAQITQKVESNAVFAIIPQKYIAPLQKEYFFYVWNEQTSEVRWMCSFDTTEEDINQFVAVIKKIVK